MNKQVPSAPAERSVLGISSQLTHVRQQIAQSVAASGRAPGSVKYWPSVGRIDNVHGDRNLFCSCVPLSAYAADSQTSG